MQFIKKQLIKADQGYSINSMTVLGKDAIVAASEGVGPAVVFPSPDYIPAVLTSEPGGCMGFAQVPGNDGALLMITQFYPIFQSEHAGINLCTEVDGLNSQWNTNRVLEMPFVHRITGISNGDSSFLIAATVCGGKEFKDDWSKPGAVYVAEYPENLENGWETKVILDGLHRNHGMTNGVWGSTPVVFISADEGIFALGMPHKRNDDWSVQHIMQNAASELSYTDLDGDGENEFAVIEPFHGETLAVYKRYGDGWKRIFATELSFGHGLWAGELAGKPAIVVGNRSGTEDLECYVTSSTEPFAMDKVVVDEGSGTTNMDVIHDSEGDAVVASNAAHGEYAMYRVVE